MAAIVRMGLGIGFGVVMMALALMLEGGHLSSLMQGTAFVVVGGGTFGLMVMSFSAKAHVLAWRTAASKETDAASLTLTERYFQLMGAGFINFGFGGATLGLITAMENLGNPEKIGPGIAVAFTAVVYGFGLRLFVADPVRAEVAGRRVAAEVGVANVHVASATVTESRGAA